MKIAASRPLHGPEYRGASAAFGEAAALRIVPAARVDPNFGVLRLNHSVFLFSPQGYRRVQPGLRRQTAARRGGIGAGPMAPDAYTRSADRGFDSGGPGYTRLGVFLRPPTAAEGRKQGGGIRVTLALGHRQRQA